VQAALADVAHLPSSSARYQDPPYWRESQGLFGLGERDDGRYPVEPAPWYADGDKEIDPPKPTGTLRWRRALALGCGSAAWYLRRQASRCSALTTVGSGPQGARPGAVASGVRRIGGREWANVGLG
jgi:hypothetical protein